MAKRQRQKEWIPYERLAAYVEAAKPLRTQAFLAIMYATGCRIGEICRHYPHHYKQFKTKKRTKTPRSSGNISIVYEREYLGVKEEITHGIRKSDISLTKRALFIILPNFKFKKMKKKRAYISRKAEPWLCDIILAYLDTIPENGYLFNFGRSRAHALLKKTWPWTTHSVRFSRSMHLYYDMSVGLREIADILGHSGVNHLMSYLKTRPEYYLDKMEAAELPRMIK